MTAERPKRRCTARHQPEPCVGASVGRGGSGFARRIRFHRNACDGARARRATSNGSRYRARGQRPLPRTVSGHYLVLALGSRSAATTSYWRSALALGSATTSYRRSARRYSARGQRPLTSYRRSARSRSAATYLVPALGVPALGGQRALPRTGAWFGHYLVPALGSALQRSRSAATYLVPALGPSPPRAGAQFLRALARSRFS